MLELAHWRLGKNGLLRPGLLEGLKNSRIKLLYWKVIKGRKVGLHYFKEKEPTFQGRKLLGFLIWITS